MCIRDSSNPDHPLKFYTSGTGGNGATTYDTNVIISGSHGYSGGYTKITVTNSTPTKLYYGCGVHPGMGGSSFNMISSVWGIGIGTFATGDIIYADATNNLTKLAAGSDGQTLKMGATIPEWGTVADVDVSSATGIGTTASSMVKIGNTSVGLNLNFSSKNLHINGNIPSSAGQVLYYDGTDVKWSLSLIHI